MRVMSLVAVLHMRVMSLVAVVAPRTGKIVKNGVFLKYEKICYKMVYYILHLDSVNHQKSRCKVRI